MPPRTTRFIRGGAYLTGALLLVVSALFSDLALQSQVYRFETPTFDAIDLPSSTFLGAVSLNYTTFAADIAWVGALVEYGETTRTGHSSEHLLDNGYVISELDPRFRRIYDWFPDTAIAKTATPSEDEMAEINGLVDEGIEAFPNDGELPYSAAMNFVGYGERITDERKLRETRRAISYLQTATERQGTPSNAPFVLQWFRNRELRLLGKEPDDEQAQQREVEMLAQMLITVEDPMTRDRIRRQIEASGEAGERIAAQQLELEQVLRKRQEASPLRFLPTDLWIATELP